MDIDIIWDDEKLQNLCNIATFAYLSSAHNSTRLQNPLANFEKSFQLVFGQQYSAELQTSVRKMFEDNGKKRRLEGELYELWTSKVGGLVYSKLKDKLSRDYNTKNISNALQGIFTDTNLLLEIETCNFKRNIVERKNPVAKLSQLYLYVKESSEHFNVRFNVPTDKLTEPMLKDGIVCFIKTGVKYLTAKLGFYEAVCLGDKEKAGKWANALGTIPGTAIGAAISHATNSSSKTIVNIVGKISDAAIQNYAKTDYKDKATRIIKYCTKFSTTSEIYRCNFIKAFLEICVAFQHQIIQIRLVDGWDTYLKLLAIEIAGRITNYIGQENNDLCKVDVCNETACEKFIGFLVKAALQGESKQDFAPEIIPKKLQYFDITKPGFPIKELGDGWRSTDMLQQVGIFYGDKFYKPRNSGSNLELYGFRYLLQFEEFDEDSLKMADRYLNSNYDQLPPDNNVYASLVPDYYKFPWVGNNAKQHDFCTLEIHKEVDREIILNNEKLASLETNKNVKLLLEKLDKLILPNPYTKYTIQFDVPRCRKLFVGREKDMELLYKFVCESRPISEHVSDSMTIITGLGGIGKSELASQFMKVNAHCFEQNIIWINAENETSIYHSFQRLASRLIECTNKTFVLVSSNAKDLAAKIYEQLATRNYLIVFDNWETEIEHVGNINMLSNYLPTKISNKLKQRIIITSRPYEKSWEKYYKVVPLKNLSELASKNFLLESCNTQNKEDNNCEHDAIELAKLLQGLPLALQQAAAFINETNGNLSKFYKNYGIGDYFHELQNISKSEEFQRLFGKLPENDLSLPYKKTIWTTWQITIKQIQKDENALSILHCMAFLKPDNIPSTIFIGIIQKTSTLDNIYDICGSAICLLERYSMISVTQEPDEPAKLSMHRLVQEVIRHNLDTQNKILAIQNCFEILKNAEKEEEKLISYLETIFVNHSLPFDDFYSILNENGNFMLQIAEIFSKRSALSFGRFCNAIMPAIILGKDNQVFENKPDWFLNFLTIIEMRQSEIIKKVNIQIKYLKMIFNSTHKNYKPLLTKLNLLISCLQNKLIFEVNVNTEMAFTCFQKQINDITDYANCAVPTVADLSIDRTNAKNVLTLICYNDVYCLILYALFPLLIEDDSTIDFLLYLTHEFNKKLSKNPKIEIHTCICFAYFWFKLNQEMAAIVELQHSVCIFKNMRNVDLKDLDLISDTIDLFNKDYLDNEAIELNFKELLGIKQNITSGSSIDPDDVVLQQLEDYVYHLIGLIQ